MSAFCRTGIYSASANTCAGVVADSCDVPVPDDEGGFGVGEAEVFEGAFVAVVGADLAQLAGQPQAALPPNHLPSAASLSTTAAAVRYQRRRSR